MMAGESRLARWQNDVAVVGRSGIHRERDRLDTEARAALDVALAASQEARARWERDSRIARARAGRLGAFSGVAALGLAWLAISPASSDLVHLGLTGGCGVVAIAALSALVGMTWRNQTAPALLAQATASDLTGRARQLIHLAAMLDDQPGLSASALLARLIADVGRAAEGARDHERDVRVAAPIPARRHERIVPRETRVTITAADGRRLIARIIDVSRSGVALEGNFPGCSVGHRVTVGSHAARVVRILPRGLACEFSDVLPDTSLTPNVVL